jgi:TonB family protein
VRCDSARAWLGAEEIVAPKSEPTPIVFELVEPSAGPEPAEVPPTRFVSTKKSLAQSESDSPEEGNALPRSEGESPLLENRSGGPEAGAGHAGEGTVTGGLLEDVMRRSEEGEAPAKSLPLSPAEMRREITRSLEERRFDNRSGSSAIPGDLSFHTVDFEFAPYLLLLKERIEEKWYPPVAFRGGLPYRGESVARFTIERSGALSGVELLREADHPSLDTAALNAIRFSAPFPPLPDGFPEERWVITCTFYYR